jgi:hypothetical protein
MNKPLLSVAALLCAPVLLAFQPRGTKVSFDLSDGSSLSKNFTTVISLNLDDMSMTMNGSPSPVQPEMELSTMSTTSISITDSYVNVADGMPVQLERTFDEMTSTTSREMEMNMMGQSESQNLATDASSDLEGYAIRFAWDQDAEEFKASFLDEDGEAELLEGLSEDMDLRVLLPEGEVAEGDEWKIDPVALKHVFAPGGNMHFIPEESDDDDPMSVGSDMGGTNDWFNDDIEGEASAKLVGLGKNDDGVHLATIEFVFELSNAVDFTESAQEALEGGEMPPAVDDMNINSVDTDINIEGKGTLLWNMDDGCLYSLDVSSDLELTLDMSMDISANGRDIEIGQLLEFNGNISTTASVE